MVARFKELYGRALSIAIETCGQCDIDYYPKAGGSFRINAVFDQEHEFVEASTEALVSAIQPRIGVRLSDLPFRPQERDVCRIEGKRYEVVDSQEDGQGGATLLLHETFR